MKYLIALFCLLPVVAHAQHDARPFMLATDHFNKQTGEIVKRTYWYPLANGTLRRPLNIIYRLSQIDTSYFMEVKVSIGGRRFVVPRNAMLQLLMENGEVFTLFNSDYFESCKGCGSKKEYEADEQGAHLRYPLPARGLKTLSHNFAERISLYLNEHDVLEQGINVSRSELLQEEADVMMYSR